MDSTFPTARNAAAIMMIGASLVGCAETSNISNERAIQDIYGVPGVTASAIVQGRLDSTMVFPRDQFNFFRAISYQDLGGESIQSLNIQIVPAQEQNAHLNGGYVLQELAQRDEIKHYEALINFMAQQPDGYGFATMDLADAERQNLPITYISRSGGRTFIITFNAKGELNFQAEVIDDSGVKELYDSSLSTLFEQRYPVQFTEMAGLQFAYLGEDTLREGGFDYSNEVQNLLRAFGYSSIEDLSAGEGGQITNIEFLEDGSIKITIHPEFQANNAIEKVFLETGAYEFYADTARWRGADRLFLTRIGDTGVMSGAAFDPADRDSDELPAFKFEFDGTLPDGSRVVSAFVLIPAREID
jgi:hypothetical protein